MDKNINKIMENLKINYIDWWDDGKDFVFSQILRQKYNLIFSEPNECDIVFTGPFNNMRSKDLVSSYKIHYTGENSRNPNNIDFSLNYNIDSDYRLPIYYVMSNEKTFIDKKPSPLLVENRMTGSRNKFCGFLVSNPSNQIRNQAFLEVSKYKHVESGGLVYNNIGFKVDNTHEWMSQYKFFICFENSKHDYYITEKLINAYYSGCIPIYWGSNTVDSELNEKCMINVNKMSSYDEMINRIKEIDNDDSLYRKMLSEPLLKNNNYDEKYNSDGLLDTFSSIIKKAKERR